MSTCSEPCSRKISIYSNMHNKRKALKSKILGLIINQVILIQPVFGVLILAKKGCDGCAWTHTTGIHCCSPIDNVQNDNGYCFKEVQYDIIDYGKCAIKPNVEKLNRIVKGSLAAISTWVFLSCLCSVVKRSLTSTH